MDNEDRAVDRFRRAVAFLGLINGQTIDVRVSSTNPMIGIGQQFTLVLRKDQSGSLASEESDSQPLRRRSRKTCKAALHLHVMIFAIACWIHGFQDGEQLPKAL